MATQTQDLTADTAADLSTDLTLTASSDYWFEAGAATAVTLFSATAAPDPADVVGHRLAPGERIRLPAPAAGALYAWTTGVDGIVIVTEG